MKKKRNIKRNIIIIITSLSCSVIGISLGLGLNVKNHKKISYVTPVAEKKYEYVKNKKDDIKQYLYIVADFLNSFLEPYPNSDELYLDRFLRTKIDQNFYQKLSQSNLFNLDNNNIKYIINQAKNLTTNPSLKNIHADNISDLIAKIFKNGLSAINTGDIEFIKSIISNNIIKEYLDFFGAILTKGIKNLNKNNINFINKQIFNYISKSWKLDKKEEKNYLNILSNIFTGWKNKYEFKEDLLKIIPEIKTIKINKTIGGVLGNLPSRGIGKLNFNINTLVDLFYDGKFNIIEGPVKHEISNIFDKAFQSISNVVKNGILYSSEDLKNISKNINELFKWIKENQNIIPEKEKESIVNILDKLYILFNNNNIIKNIAKVIETPLKNIDKQTFIEIFSIINIKNIINFNNNKNQKIFNERLINSIWKMFKSPKDIDKNDLLILQKILIQKNDLFKKINQGLNQKNDNLFLILQKIFTEWNNNSYYRNVLIEKIKTLKFNDQKDKTTIHEHNKQKILNKKNKLLHEFTKLKKDFYNNLIKIDTLTLSIMLQRMNDINENLNNLNNKVNNEIEINILSEAKVTDIILFNINWMIKNKRLNPFIKNLEIWLKNSKNKKEQTIGKILTKIQNKNIFDLNKEDIKKILEFVKNIIKNSKLNKQKINTLTLIINNFLKGGIKNIQEKNLNQLTDFHKEISPFISLFKELLNKNIKLIDKQTFMKYVPDLLCKKLNPNISATKLKNIIWKLLKTGWGDNSKDQFKEDISNLIPQIKNINIHITYGYLIININFNNIVDWLYDGNFKNILPKSNTNTWLIGSMSEETNTSIKLLTHQGLLNNVEKIETFILGISEFLEGISSSLVSSFINKEDLKTINSIINIKEYLPLIKEALSKPIKNISKKSLKQISNLLTKINIFDDVLYNKNTDLKIKKEKIDLIVDTAWKFFNDPQSINQKNVDVISLLFDVHNQKKTQRYNIIKNISVLLLKKLFINWNYN